MSQSTQPTKLKIEVSKDISSQIQEILVNRLAACRNALKTLEPHEGIHEARKELKQIRSVIRLARSVVSRQMYQDTNRYFRDVGRLLSDARDTTALLDVVLSLRNRISQPELQAQLNQVAHHLMAKKAAVTRYQINRDGLLQRTIDVLENAEDYVEAFCVQEEDFGALTGGIERVYARGQYLSQMVKKHPDPDVFHEWRKRAKYLRYQLGTISDIWPTMINAWEKELHQLTDALGTEHDLFVLHETVLQANFDKESNWNALFNYITIQRKQQQLVALTLGKKLYFWQPKRFVNWLRNSWNTTAEAFT